MKAVEDTGPFVGQVVAAFGEQPQDGALVFGEDAAQAAVARCDVGDARAVSGIGFAGSAGVEQAGADGQCRRHVEHLFIGGGQLLGDAAAEAVGVFDREASLRPSPCPACQLSEGSSVDREPASGQLSAGGVNGDGGQGGLVRVDSDGDH